MQYDYPSRIPVKIQDRFEPDRDNSETGVRRPRPGILEVCALFPSCATMLQERAEFQRSTLHAALVRMRIKAVGKETKEMRCLRRRRYQNVLSTRTLLLMYLPVLPCSPSCTLGPQTRDSIQVPYLPYMLYLTVSEAPTRLI